MNSRFVRTIRLVSLIVLIYLLRMLAQIEIPLPVENRYHSVFACPVSKEQSTEQNPPMMMSCGHVITKDSLQKLSKQGGCVANSLQAPIKSTDTRTASSRIVFRRVKCPYCPNESVVSAPAHQTHEYNHRKPISTDLMSTWTGLKLNHQPFRS